MNSRSNFYIVSNFLKTLLQSDPLINTVVIGRTNETDLYKKNIFPIAHIIPVNSPWLGNGVSAFTFQIGVLEQRDIPSVKKNTKFEGDDNMIDNLNATYAVINNLLSYLENQNNDFFIELQNVGGIQPFLFVKENLLDGFYVTLTLTIKNDNVCFDYDFIDEDHEEELICEEGVTYAQMTSIFIDPFNPTNQTDIKNKTAQEIEGYWLDNENYALGLGGLNVYLCGVDSRFELGSIIKYTSNNHLVDSLHDGYYLVNQTGASGTSGDLNYRYNPSRTSPYNFNNLEPNDPIPFSFWSDTVEPVLIRIENAVVVEVITLPITGFSYEN